MNQSTPEATSLNGEANGVIAKIVAKGEPAQIRYEKRGHVAYFIFDGSNDLNACTAESYRSFYHHLCDFRDDPEMWVGVLTGAGDRAFSVGGDLKEMRELTEASSPEAAARNFWYPRSSVPSHTSQVAEDIFTLELYKPIIGAVNGLCLGGGFVYLLALADIRVASDDAVFGFSEVKRGLGGGGGLSGLAHELPRAWAMWLCLTGETIDAERAFQIGLINEVVPKGTVHARATELANMLCETSPVVLKMEKELLMRTKEMPRREMLRFSWVMHFANRYGHDASEGLRAWQEDRDPEYVGW